MKTSKGNIQLVFLVVYVLASLVSITIAKAQLTASELSAVGAQVSKCWNIPAGALNANDLTVEIRVTANPDGSITRADIVDTGRLNDPVFRQAAESARRAFFNPACTPLKLPTEKYAAWKTLTVTFGQTGGAEIAGGTSASSIPLQEYRVEVGDACFNGAAVLCNSVPNSFNRQSVSVSVRVPDWHLLQNNNLISQLLAKMLAPGRARCASVNPNADVVAASISASNFLIDAVVSACWADGEWHIKSRVAELTQQEAAARAEKERQQADNDRRATQVSAREKAKQALLMECGREPQLSGGPLTSWLSSSYSIGARTLAAGLIYKEKDFNFGTPFLCVKTIEYVSGAPKSVWWERGTRSIYRIQSD